METRGVKGILEFPLPEEQNRFDVACKSLDFALAWNQLREQIRRQIKYENLSLDVDNKLRNILDQIEQLSVDYNLPELE